MRTPHPRGTWIQPTGSRQGGTIGAGLNGNITYDNPYKATGSTGSIKIVLDDRETLRLIKRLRQIPRSGSALLNLVRNSSAIPSASEFAMQVPQGALLVTYRYQMSVNLDKRCNMDYNESVSKTIDHGTLSPANAQNHMKEVDVRIDCNSGMYSLSLSTNNPGTNQYDNALSVNMSRGGDAALVVTAPHCTQHPQYLTPHLRCTSPTYTPNNVKLTSTLKQTDSASGGTLSGTAVLTATID